MKNFIPKFLIATLALSVNAFAKDQGILQISLEETSGNPIMNGNWSCGRTFSHSYTQKFKTAQGVEKTAVKKGTSKVKLDMASTAKISVKVIDTCQQEQVQSLPSMTCDGNNNCTTTYNENRYITKMTVNRLCVFENPPTTVGAKLSSSCKVSSRENGFLRPSLMQGLLGQRIKAHLTLSQRYEHVDVNLCRGKSLKNRKIIKVSQGLEGLMWENDFKVKIEIPGNRPVILKSQNGIFNQEIAVCEEGDIKAKVTALEVDPIWDDVYECHDKSNRVHLSTTTPKKKVARVNFKRGSLAPQLKLEIR